MVSTTNRDNIALAMTAVLFVGGIGVLALGVTRYYDETFSGYLDDLIKSISGNQMSLDDFHSKLKQEPQLFIVGGGVLMFLGVFGLLSVVSGIPVCRRVYQILLLICFAIFATVVVFAILGRWGVKINDERERLRVHWRNMSDAERIVFEERLDCCDFDTDSPRRQQAVWLGGCETIIKGCFTELSLVESEKRMASIFIWATIAFVVCFFFAFNCMVDHAEI